METILSNHNHSTAGIFKIQPITGQFRRFENDFSSIENINTHAIQSQRCRLQFRLPNHIQTHFSFDNNKTNIGFAMNKFGLQRLCFELINNTTKQQQQQRIHILPIMTEIDKTQIKKKTINLSSPSTINLPINIPPASTTTNSSIVPILSSPSSSSIFNGSIDHV
ncbi:unnamed protein product [Adineta steineri]|uniref:Uncharacterized protein n=1 Tax=Adineta steineri TaxID=433720 RepID=A0A816DJK5_9BILA|nr:unnamed protein product [Adineta steineri]CAF1635575.1 unnamed protein product [Adineta steineri]